VDECDRHTSLADCRRDPFDRAQPHVAACQNTGDTRFAPVYGWFTEGFDTLDLKEAKSLLDELHA
jgi:hypothetical protein